MRSPRPIITYDRIKRLIDLSVASFSLVLLAPVMAVSAVAVYLSVGKPVLFRQERPGLDGRPFTLYKFRTMNDACCPDGEPLPDAERITRVGKALRSMSLDELPELVNVLKGDMTLVGPRPLLMEYLPLYSAEQARRHDVRPGLTGWAQINGRNEIAWEERLSLDVWYVENRSIGLDLHILLRTFTKVLSREGISQSGHSTRVRFRGSRSE